MTEPLTLITALRESVVMWERLAETGDNKGSLVHNDPTFEHYQYYDSYCALCEYQYNERWDCEDCPLAVEAGVDCTSSDSIYTDWYAAKTVAERKLLARTILGHLESALTKHEEETND